MENRNGKTMNLLERMAGIVPWNEQTMISEDENITNSEIEEALKPMVYSEKGQFKAINSFMLRHAQGAPSLEISKQRLRMGTNLWMNGLKLTERFKVHQVQGIAWMVQRCETIGGCILADDMGLGKTLQVLGVIIAMNNDREEGLRIWQPPKPTLIVVPKIMVREWMATCKRFLDWEYNITEYTADKSPNTLTAMDLQNLNDPGHVIIITTYEFLRTRHGPEARKEQQWGNNCVGVLIGDECHTLKYSDREKTKTIASLEADYHLMISGTPAENREKDIIGPLSLFMSDDLWETLEIPRNINPYTKINNDASEAVLRATPYAINTYLLNEDTKEDFIKRGVMLAQVYEIVLLRRSYGLNGIGDDVPAQKSTVITAKFHPTEVAKMQSIYDSNRDKLYTEIDGEIRMDGKKARNLVQSMLWRPFGNLEWRADDIEKYRVPSKTFRHFLGDFYSEIGASMGFNPNNMSDEDILQKVCVQSPKLKILCKAILEIVYGRNTKLAVWVEYPWEQAFLEMVLKTIGVDARALYSEMNQEERSECVRLFTTRHDEIKVFILSYRVGGLGLNLPQLCWHTIVLTRPVSKAVEDQGIFRVRRINQTREQFVIKVVIKDSWDDDRQAKFEEKALPDFYAQTQETNNVKWALTDEEREKKKPIRRVVRQLFRHIDGDGDGKCGLRFD